MTYERALRAAYGTGLFHVVLMLLATFTNILPSFEYHSVVFMQYEPEFTCNDESLSKHAKVTWTTEEDMRRISMGGGSEGVPSLAVTEKQCWAIVETAGDKFAFTCSSWTYNASVMHRTLVTDFNLVCSRQSFSYWLSTSLLMGAATGHLINLFTGGLSRRRLFVFYAIWEVTLTVVGIFGGTVAVVFILRFLRMLAIPITYLAVCILQETLPTEKRAVFGNAFWAFSSLAPLVAATLASATRNWFSLRLYGLLLFIPYIPLIFLMPESPRWLVLNRKYVEFADLLRCIARWNGVDQINAQELRDALEDVPSGDRRRSSPRPRDDTCLDIFRLPNMRLKAITLIANASASMMAYYGLSMNPKAASANIFLNMYYLAVAEIPAAVIGWALTTTMGRRPTFIVIYTIIAPSLILSSYLQSTMPILSTTLVMIGRLGVGITSNVSALCITECYPTSVRNLGLCLSLAISCGLTGLVPFINALGEQVFVCLPGIIYAVWCLIAGVLALAFLPETKHCPLAQTLSEAEALVPWKEDKWIAEMTQ